MSEDAGLWRANPESLEMGYSEDGAYYMPEDHGGEHEKGQFVIDVEGPLDLRNGSFTIVFEADEDFRNSGAHMQPFAQDKQVWTGNWGAGCWIDGGMDEGEHTTTCNITGEDSFNLAEGEEAQIGVQVPGDSPDPAGTFTIKSMTIQLQ